MPDNNITGITNINAAIDTNKSIAEVLSSINLDEMPYIQRDFVWLLALRLFNARLSHGDDFNLGDGYKVRERL